MQSAERPSGDRRADRPKIRSSIWLLIAGATALALLLLGAFYLSEQQRRSEEWVRHTLDVENRITLLWSAIQSAETQQRGFVISRQASYLEKYQASLRSVSDQLAELTKATADNPTQQRSLAKLKPQLEGRINALNLGISKLESAGLAAVAEHVAGGTGTAYMEAARAAIEEIGEDETRLLGERQRYAARWRAGLQRFARRGRPP